MPSHVEPRLIEDLTPREREVLDLLRSGLTNQEIAVRLSISPDGAKYHVSEIIGKLGVRSRYEASAWPKRPPWWMGAVAPLGMLWRRLGWLPQIAAASAGIAVTAGLGFLIWGLLRTNSDGPSTLPDNTVAAIDRVSFARGETVTGSGAGFYFIDPATGETEGWVMTRLNTQSFPVIGMSADGRYVLYPCQNHAPDNSTVSCDPNATTADPIWFYFDTQSGERTRLPDDMEYRSLSPDGKTVLALQGDMFLLTDIPDIGNTRLLPPTGEAYVEYWSPQSDALVISSQQGTVLVETASGETTPLIDSAYAAVSFSPDGSRIAVVLPPDNAKPPELPSGTFVYDRNGNELWSSPITGIAPNARWSPDGTLLAINGETLPDVRDLRLHVFDGATGEEQYRIEGAIACQGPIWTADGAKLVIGSYTRQGSVLADPATQSFLDLGAYTTPSPFDPSLGISFDGFDFSTVNFDTGETALLTHTTVGPGWDPLHEPLFVGDRSGDRIAFAAPHGGHGGCLGGGAPDPLPELAWQFPPFDKP